MASYGSVTLGDSAVYKNEFDDKNSAVKNTIKRTEEGRKFVFQTPIQKPRDELTLEFKDDHCLSYATIKSLRTLRDAGSINTLTLASGETLSAILDKINAPALIDYANPDDADLFKATLIFIEV